MEIKLVDFEMCSIEREGVSCEDLKSVGDAIYESFSTIGFMYLKNTGISDEEAAEIRLLTKKFFDLDDATKTKFAIDANCFGYVALGRENNNPYKPGEFKHTFDISGDGLVCENTKWPDTEVPGFSSMMKCFAEKLRLLATRIMEALSYGMKIKDKEYLKNCHSRMNGLKNTTTLRNLYYPTIPKEYVAKKDEMRLGEHTDFGSFTILFQDKARGLQVKRRDGTYIDATPIPGTALINIGDALQFWTRGRLKSTEHRIMMPDVTGKDNVERSSLVYFIRPDHEVMMSEIECEEGTDFAVPQDGADEPIKFLQHIQRCYEEINMPVPI